MRERKPLRDPRSRRHANALRRTLGFTSRGQNSE
jgi:hypothetical protein